MWAKADAAKGPLGQSAKVRQALELAIDRAALNQVVFNGEFVPGNQWVSPEGPMIRNRFRCRAHERAVFGFSEVKLGITPAVISPYVLRKIGESAARRYFVTGERFDATTALRIGLVHEVVTDLDAALETVLGELRTAGPRAARHAKRLVLDRPDGPETARRIAERRASDEGQAGLGAFIERRRPPWAPPLEPDA